MNLKNLAGLTLGFFLSISQALAGSSPNLTYGQVLTPAQWNQLFINKEDELGYTPLNTGGGSMTGRLITAAPSATTAGFNLTPGSTPSTPADGDMWTTTTGLFVRINGSTIGPIGTAACPTCAVTNETNTFTALQIINLNATAAPTILGGATLQIVQVDALGNRIELDSFAAQAVYSGARSNGTNALPTTLILDDEILSLQAHGYDGTTRQNTRSGSVRFISGGTWSNTSHPTYACIDTTPVGSVSFVACRVRVGTDGGVTIGSLTSQGAGTLNLAALYGNNTLIVDSSQNITGTSLTVTGGLTAGTNGGTAGTLIARGATSGAVTISPQAAAGTPSLLWPTASGTLASSGTAPIVVNATTGAISCPTCNTSGANVSTVTNADGTLTISPTSGAVVASIALTHANSWSNQTFANIVETGTSIINAAAVGGCTIGANALCVTGSAAISSTLTSAALTVTSASASALSVGLNGATNSAFRVDASTASQVAGLKITGAVTGGTVALLAIDSGSNTSISLNTKGTGTLSLNNVATGGVVIGAPTGGDKGSGTLNIGTALYINGTAVTGTGTVTSVTCGTGLSGGAITTSGTCAVSLTSLSNSIGSDIALNNTGTFFTGPTVAQGTSGTWYASGTATVYDTAAGANFYCQMTDGTTTIDSSRTTTTAANNVANIALSGIIASPAGNIRIQCKDVTSTNGVLAFNVTTLGKDSTVSTFRIQ